MNTTLTERQKEILMAIIEEYMRTAEEVGSVFLVKNYDFDVSSATVRNEMVKLMDYGYLDKSHVSSGRIPTDLAMRLYVNNRVKKSLADSQSAVNIRQGVFGVRFYPEKLIKAMLELLVEETQSASFLLMDDMTRYYGVSSLLSYDELKNIEAMQRVLDLLEDEHLLKSVFNKYDGEEVSVLIGSELGIKDLDQISLAFCKFNFWEGRIGHMGVIGSRRMNYQKAVPTLYAMKESLADALKGWQ